MRFLKGPVVPFFVGRLASSIAALAVRLPSVAILKIGRFLSSIAALAGCGAPFGRMFNERGIFVQHCCARWGVLDWIACRSALRSEQASFLRGITQVTTPRYRGASFSFLFAQLSKLTSLPKKKNPQLLLRVTCCPTWIRTKTY